MKMTEIKKTEHNTPIKAGIGYTVGNILVNGIAFLSVPIFTRLLSTEDFGIYSSFITYQAILAMVIGLTLHTSLKNAKYDFPKERKEYNSSSLLLMVFLFLFFLALGAVFQNPLEKMLSLDASFMVPLVIYSFASALMMFFNASLVLDYHYKAYLRASLFFSITSIALSVIFILFCFPENRAYGRILGGVIPIAMVGCYILWYYFRQKAPKINFAYWKYGLKISLPLVPHGLSQLILTQFDRIMILNMIGAAAAGIYSLAYTLAMVLQIIFSSLDSIWTTWFFEKMSKDQRADIKEKSRYYVILISLLTVMFFLAAPEMIKIFAGKSYWDAQYVVIPVALALYFSFLYYFPAGVEYYHKKTIFIALGTMAAAGVNILLNLWLIPIYGYVIAAYTTLVSYILYFCLHLFIVWKIEHRFVFDMKAILISLTATVIWAFLARVFLFMPLIRWSLFLILLAITIYGAYKKKELLRNFLKKEPTDAV